MPPPSPPGLPRQIAPLRDDLPPPPTELPPLLSPRTAPHPPRLSRAKGAPRPAPGTAPLLGSRSTAGEPFESLSPPRQLRAPAGPPPPYRRRPAHEQPPYQPHPGAIPRASAVSTPGEPAFSPRHRPTPRPFPTPARAHTRPRTPALQRTRTPPPLRPAHTLAPSRARPPHPLVYPATSTIFVISGGAPSLAGGPAVPKPRFT